MINPDALFYCLMEQGLQPEMVEEDTEVVVCCPLCQDDRPRLYVNAETGAWTCFHCHEQGGLHRLLMVVCELDASTAFETARTLIVADDDIDQFESAPRKEVLTDAILRLPSQFRPIDRDTPKVFLNYLQQRGVSPELAAQRGLGYAISGRYAYRVIVPVENDGKLYTFVARTVLTRCPNCEERLNDCSCRPRKFPKVLTPSKKEGAHPSHALYNLDVVRASRGNRLIVVEGVFDVLRRANESVAILGSSASATQVNLIAGLAGSREVVLALDPDTAGYAGALKLANDLTGLEVMGIKIALLPQGEDVGSLDAPTLDRCLKEARDFIFR